MSFVIKPGEKVIRFVCPICGQVEGYFTYELNPDEAVACGNCGSLMMPIEKGPAIKPEDPIPEPEPKVEPDPQTEVMELKSENAPVEEPVRRRGRPPKVKSSGRGSCNTCSKALTAIHGYTCEEDWKTHRGDDNCNKYKQGKPVD